MNKYGGLDDQQQSLFIAVDRLHVSALDCSKNKEKMWRVLSSRSQCASTKWCDGWRPSLCEVLQRRSNGLCSPGKGFQILLWSKAETYVQFHRRRRARHSQSLFTSCLKTLPFPTYQCAFVSVWESPGLAGQIQLSKSKAGIMSQCKSKVCHPVLATCSCTTQIRWLHHYTPELGQWSPCSWSWRTIQFKWHGRNMLARCQPGVRERQDTSLNMCISPSNYEGVISDKGLSTRNRGVCNCLLWFIYFFNPLSKKPT